MTIAEVPAVSARRERDPFQTVTVDGQTISANELEELSQYLRDPKVQERIRNAFGIPRHRRPLIRRVFYAIHSFFN